MDNLCNKLTYLSLIEKEKYVKYVKLIQTTWKTYKLKINKSKTTLKNTINDGMTFELLAKCIDNYNSTVTFENEINKQLKYKKIRQTNFLSHISENIAKFAYYKKHNIMPTWDTKTGDLEIKSNKKKLKIEVKGSINLSNGPPTFGPTEKWNIILFVDAINTMKKRYIVYEFNISNASDKWKNLKINKTQTFEDQCKQKRRPRLKFSEIKKQLLNDCVIIFNGHINDLQLI